MNDERVAGAEARVNEVLARLPALSDEDVDQLVEEWAAQDQGAREAGWRVVKQAAETPELQDLLDGAREVTLAWAADRQNDYAGIEGLLGRPGAGAAGRQAAVPAILDAVAAAVAADSLPPEEYEALSGPWATLR